MEGKKILIVEDEQDLSNLLSLHLSDLGASVTIAINGHEGLRQACFRKWDVIILDIQLPGPSGLDICRKVRQNQNSVPILFLTSRATEQDRVLGLNVGADDYLTKPFSTMELIARIRALLRRVNALVNSKPKSLEAEESIQLGPIRIDEFKRQAHLSGELIDFTAKEFSLLLYFCRQPGRVFRRSELLDDVWGYGHEGYEHTVNTHINRLRAKIELNPKKPKYIVTVWGVGYKLDIENLC